MRARSITVGLAVVVAVVASPAVAVHDVGCGGEWRRATSCAFALQGLPVTVFADAEPFSGVARVRVQVVAVTPVGEHEVLACEAEGSGYVSCSEEIGIGERVNPFLQTVPLICRVHGTGPGTYACASFADAWVPPGAQGA